MPLHTIGIQFLKLFFTRYWSPSMKSPQIFWTIYHPNNWNISKCYISSNARISALRILLLLSSLFVCTLTRSAANIWNLYMGWCIHSIIRYSFFAEKIVYIFILENSNYWRKSNLYFYFTSSVYFFVGHGEAIFMLFSVLMPLTNLRLAIWIFNLSLIFFSKGWISS